MTVNIELINATTREGAQKALDLALATQKAAQAALNAAKESQRAATVAVNAAKNEMMAADGVVLLAKAELARLGGPLTTGKAPSGKSQSDVQRAAKKVLTAAGKPLTVDDIYKGVQAEGVEMAGANPRDNLAAYLARWSKVDGSGFENKGRGLWGITGTTAPAEVPTFLQPAETPAPVVANEKVDVAVDGSLTEVPAFLTPPEAPVTEVIVEPEQVPVDEEATPEQALPDGFPGLVALNEAGFTTLESLSGKTFDQIRRIRGVGAETARQIIAALNPEA